MNLLRKLPKLATVSLSFSAIASLKLTHNHPKASLFEIFDWPKTSPCACFFLLLNHRMIVAIFPDMTRDLTFSAVSYEGLRIRKPTFRQNQAEVVTALRTVCGANVAMQLMVNISILWEGAWWRIQQCKSTYWMLYGCSPPPHPCPQKN